MQISDTLVFGECWLKGFGSSMTMPTRKKQGSNGRALSIVNLAENYIKDDNRDRKKESKMGGERLVVVQHTTRGCCRIWGVARVQTS